MYVALERVWAFYINRLPNWLRVGSLLVALFLGSVAFSLLLVRDRATIALLLVAAPVGVAVVALVARYFVSALLLLPVTALTLPIIQFSTGTASTVPWSLALSLLLVGIWLVSMANRGWQLAPAAMNRPLLIFMVICIISLPWGLIWRDPILNMRIMGNFMVVQIGSLLTLLVSMAVPLLLAQFITRQWQIKFYLGA
ncbi:MAG: O-antigen ligase domain-containing protein, partial [Chloroflexaceae bacterium]|nr:O-antigen ligase domain-containing protein [Chloroflexaceae bacterium]